MPRASVVCASGAAAAVAFYVWRRKFAKARPTAAAAGTTTVRAVASMEAGSTPEPWSYEMAAATPAGHVDVRVTHCGLCHSDIHQIDNGWGVSQYPLVAGHEIVGVVVGVGTGVRAQCGVGARVAIGVQRSNCGGCECCSGRMENLCPSIGKTYLGPANDRGGFAEVIRYPAAWAFPCPPGLASEHVAPLMCAGITTFSPLRRFARRGMRVGVLGIGGLGHLAIQIAKAMGCTVVAISRSDSKREEAAGFGAAAFLLSSDKAACAAAAGSMDLILNTISGNADLDAYMALLRPRGRMVCAGLPSKDEPTRFYLHSAVIKEREIIGSYLGPYADYAAMLAFCAKHQVVPCVEVMPISRIAEAVQRVRDNKARYRCVMTVQGV